MKFLKNLATDLAANSARFIYNIESGASDMDKTKITAENAKEHLEADTLERLEALGHTAEALKAAEKANEMVADKLPKFAEALKNLGANPDPKELQRLAMEYLVYNDAASSTSEIRNMYRTEMFASFRKAFLGATDALPNLTNDDISMLLLKGMGAVYKFSKNERTAGSSLRQASRMIRYDKQVKGSEKDIDVRKWVEGGKKLTSYAPEMENSKLTATVNNGKLVLGNSEIDIKGCEILTGAAMMDYPADYLSKFEFRNVIRDGNRVMACVDNGCHGNLAVFELKNMPDTPIDDETCLEEQIDNDPCADCNNETKDALLILKGWDKADPRYKELMCDLTGEVHEKQEDAYNAYIKLYGRTKGEYKMEGVEKDGVYVVLEKYFNPKLKGGLHGMMRRLLADKSLSKSFEKAGYSEEEAEKLQLAFASQGAALAGVEKNADRMAKKYEHRDAGATKDFFLRLGAGAVIGAGVSAALGFPPGWAIPALLGGAPLVGLDTGIKGFEQVMGVDEVHAILANPEASDAELDKIFTVFQKVEGQKTYLDLQKESLLAVDVQNEALYQTLSDTQTLIDGPNSKNESELNYDLEGYTDELDDAMEQTNKQLLVRGEAYEQGLSKEANQTRRAKGLKLEGAKFLWMGGHEQEVNVGTEESPKVKKMTERAAYDFYIEQGNDAPKAEEKLANYNAALNLLTDEVNETASKKRNLGPEWGEGFTVNGLNDRFDKGQEINLGTLDNNDKYKLHAKFVLDKDGAAQGGPKSGTWEVYVKNDGVIDAGSKMEFASGTDMKALTKKELKENGGVLKGERGEIEDRLGFFGNVVGHMAQINEVKDHMNLIVETEKRQDVTQENDEMFDYVYMENGSRVENASERKYRLGVEGTLKKFTGYEQFEQKFEMYKTFTPESLKLVKAYYEGSEDAVQNLVENKDFQGQLACVAVAAKRLETFVQLDDMDECLKCAKDEMYFSGEAAIEQSKYKTINFGEVYGAYMIGKGLLTPKFVEKVQEFKAESAAQMTKDEIDDAWDELFEELIEEEGVEMVAEVVNNTTRGLTIRRGIIALTGGVISNAIIDRQLNKPTR